MAALTDSARSYDWSKGHAHVHAGSVDAQGNPDPMTPRLMIHVMQRQDTSKMEPSELK